MAELAVWNKYGWGATKEVFGIAEAQDVRVEGPDMGERIEKAKKIKGVEEGLEVIGRSKEMTQEELQWGTKMESKEELGVEGQCKHQLGEKEYMKKISQLPNFQKEGTLSGRKCMGNQEKRKEDYVGKTMGRLGTLNWREWERTRVPQWMVEGLREGFW
jgi:hypothetical protein